MEIVGDELTTWLVEVNECASQLIVIRTTELNNLATCSEFHLAPSQKAVVVERHVWRLVRPQFQRQKKAPDIIIKCSS